VRESEVARWRRGLLFLLVYSLVGASPVSAHKLNVFATVEGSAIEGEVYFPDGTPARDAAITVCDPEGQELTRTSTDQQGRFSFEPRFRCHHTLIADAGLGHQARYTVQADELPQDLPARGAASPADSDSATHGHPHDDHPGHEHRHVDSAEPGELSEELHALAQQLSALRKDLDKSKTRLRLQDLLGGIGYIVGITGLAAYFLRSRRQPA
jgi:nickel transport protein